MRVTAAILGGSATLVVLLLQAYPYVLNPSFWAEDLPIFWLQEFTREGFQTFFVAYEGYLSIIPRLIAWLAWLLPVEDHPAFYMVAAVAITVWSGALTAASAERPPMGVLMAAFLVAIPHIGEVWVTPTNVQWIMACVIPVILLMPTSASRPIRAQQVVFLVLSGLSGPFVILSAPLLAIRLWFAWRESDRFGQLLVALAVALAAIQTVAILNNPLEDRGGDLIAGTATLLIRWMGGLLYTSSAVVIAGFAAFLTVSLFVGDQRRLRWGFVLFAVATLVATAAKFGDMSSGLRPQGSGSRYFYIPSVMAAFSFITLLFERRASTLWPTVPAIVALAAMAVASARAPLRQRVPEDATEKWRSITPMIGRENVEIVFPPKWKTEIPARDRGLGDSPPQ